MGEPFALTRPPIVAAAVAVVAHLVEVAVDTEVVAAGIAAEEVMVAVVVDTVSFKDDPPIAS